MNSIVVTIDGPAGAGKSSVARRLANSLGFDFLDTGAMYRCVTLACLRNNVDLNDQNAVAAIASKIRIELIEDGIWMDGEDVTETIRLPHVTQSIKHIADNLEVRNKMVDLQRQWAINRRVVTEGRDQGTIAFPTARCKIFLTASPEERARRRVNQLQSAGLPADFDGILKQQNARDAEDYQRSIGGLKKADDAIEITTDGMSEDEVLQRLIEVVNRTLPTSSH